MLRIPGAARLDARRHAVRTGQMFDPDWVLGILAGHLRRLQEHGGEIRGTRMLEIGPGNSLGQAFLLAILGADRVTAVDVRRYATAKTGRGVYRRLVERLDRRLAEGTIPVGRSTEDWRARAAALLPEGAPFPRLDESLRYEITDGRTLPLETGSIDFAYSCSVLEHLPDPGLTYGELGRIVRPGGLMSHIIDLRDHHHPDPFHFLRYGDRLWALMQGRSAGYTNRLRASDHLGLLQKAGFEPVHVERKQAERTPTALAARFRSYDEEDLRTLTLIVAARRERKGSSVGG